MESGLIDLVFQQYRVVGVVVEERCDLFAGLGRIVACKQRTDPVAREKDVARELHLLQHLQTRTNILYGSLRPQRVVEVVECRRCPRLDTSILWQQKLLEKSVKLQRVGHRCT